MTSKAFWLGYEDTLRPEHVGRIIQMPDISVHDQGCHLCHPPGGRAPRRSCREGLRAGLPARNQGGIRMTTATSSSDRYAEAREALAHWQAVEDGHRIDAQAASEKIATALRALITPPATEETAEQITDAAMEKFAARVPPSDTVGFAAQIIRGALEDAVRAGIRAAWESWEGEVAKGATGPALLKMFAYDFAEWWESDEANDAQDIVSAQESFADNWWAEFTA